VLRFSALCRLCQKQVNDPARCFMLLSRYRLSVDVHRCAAVGVPEQFLCNLDVHSEAAQVRGQRVPERMPPNHLPDNPSLLEGRPDDLLENGVRA
jgi:hypothetical protein